MALRTLGADDVVRTHAEAAGNPRPPLLVLDPLLAFLDSHGIGSGEARFTPIGEGLSNVTCLVERGDARAVLRRPPRPPLPPSAHDMLREATVLRALAGRARVPAVLAVCEDPAVLGVPFYVMEHVPGHVLTDAMPPGLDSAAERARVATELIDALVEIHAVDWQDAGLGAFGRPTGYPARQERRFGGLWEHNKTREVPALDRVTDWLGRHLPADGAPTIVHGDYRLGNTMVSGAAPARVRAVFDWELSTIGDPLADVGYLTYSWVDREDEGSPLELSPVTRQEGFPRRAELGELYAERSGRPIGDLRWYQVLAAWKTAVFMEANYARAASGASDDEFLASFAGGVVVLAERAEAMTRGG